MPSQNSPAYVAYCCPFVFMCFQCVLLSSTVLGKPVHCNIPLPCSHRCSSFAIASTNTRNHATTILPSMQWAPCISELCRKVTAVCVLGKTAARDATTVSSEKLPTLVPTPISIPRPPQTTHLEVRAAASRAIRGCSYAQYTLAAGMSDVGHSTS
jgi:hypothetical protein